MSTWRDVHAGDIVLGHDGQEWGVLGIEHDPPSMLDRTSAVTLTRYGRTLTGRPPSVAPVIITQTADHSDTASAIDALLSVGFGVEIISESIRESA